MIVKKRDKPLHLMQLQSLERRLKVNHVKQQKVELAKIRELTGLQGERKLDFPLSFLEPNKYRVLHQIRLHDQQGYFQMDSVILHQNFMLILEVKNWFGTIVFGPNHQVKRIDDIQNEEGFPNPMKQAKLQQYRLQRWIHAHNSFKLPVIYLVVIAKPSTLIQSASSKDKIPKHVIYSNQLVFEMNRLEKQFENRYISMDELNIIAQKLKQAHTPKSNDVLKNFNIDQTELIKGVACPKCKGIPMDRIYKKWLCPFCKYKSTYAHIAALNDYLLLINDRVTNGQMREFLLIDSPYVMKYLLKRASCNYSGNTKGRYYTLELQT